MLRKKHPHKDQVQKLIPISVNDRHTTPSQLGLEPEPLLGRISLRSQWVKHATGSWGNGPLSKVIKTRKSPRLTQKSSPTHCHRPPSCYW
jgi:hypothetical protein